MMPFAIGETLNYRVAWAAFSTAASLQLSVPERRDLFGWKTWHFRASVHTQNSVRTLFAVDDEFDSYTDAFTLDSRQYELYLNEMGRKQDQVLHYAPAGQKSRSPGPDVLVLANTRDPVGALYGLRSVDWRKSPEFRIPICDGRDIYQLSAKLEEPNEMVTVAAGNFNASRIGLRVTQNRPGAPDINFEIWLANNPVRTPVQLQAQLPFGSVRAELVPASK